ncbi:juvenile hormone epoxide hydrolase-like protein 1 [Tribolium castaneum]|uniref:Epoxide hydrolase n=1 Tax=Tribolium castaneum TaxID=7070 RepID=D0W011_TRICA|nr:juvenile hormone epoxide hydrolase-like protein 1 [Tribolium castaneum]BAI49686.1 juvenile hormone epoxide hydrolase-like protein 1 [Tribolium castaneum]|eukprot:NP_001161904.1 juvenile hormone epoxide hydrolase-like protein 1 [Tribolium castaneum]
MKLATKIGLATATIITAYLIGNYLLTPTIPKLKNIWWGSRDPSTEDTTIKPFRINVSEEVLEDLQNRLANTKLTPPLEGIQHQYGLNTKLLSKIVTYWRTEYDWKKREIFLNKYPQFMVSIQGLRLHYIHLKPQKRDNVKTLPILLLHGWPGSVREFYTTIQLLTKPTKGRNFIFEVIVPSLPGFGFSEASVRPGLGPIEMAVIFKNLMKRLGHEKYLVQGGDWGALIAQQMAVLFPDQVLGIHSNLCFDTSVLSALKLALGSLYPSWVVPKNFEHRLYPLLSFVMNLVEETGYMHIQTSKPDTVGAALNDSPVGLAAYILEKFISWTNPDWKNLEDGGLLKKYTYDDLLDNIMIYWVSGSITTSMRLYSHALDNVMTIINVQRISITVPSACAIFPNEIFPQPGAMLREKYQNLVHVSENSDGGHFPAFELPHVFAEDIFVATEKMLEANSQGN